MEVDFEASQLFAVAADVNLHSHVATDKCLDKWWNLRQQWNVFGDIDINVRDGIRISVERALVGQAKCCHLGGRSRYIGELNANVFVRAASELLAGEGRQAKARDLSI